MKNLLLSAFEPFGDNELNSSEIVMAMIPDICGEVRVSKVVLPVVYETAFKSLLKIICKEKPDFVICMGQAGGRTKLSLERVAININNSESSDNRGQIFKDRTIITEGETALISSLPVFDMLAACGEEVAAISYSAGTFVCNDLFYRMQNEEAKGNTGYRSGFLHLPYTEHFGKMPFIDSVKQAETIIAMVSALGDKNG